MSLTVENDPPEKLPEPLTSSLAPGLVVPIPTLPPYGFITISFACVAASFTACIYCLELLPVLIVNLLSQLLEDFTDNPALDSVSDRLIAYELTGLK